MAGCRDSPIEYCEEEKADAVTQRDIDGDSFLLLMVSSGRSHLLFIIPSL